MSYGWPNLHKIFFRVRKFPLPGSQLSKKTMARRSRTIFIRLMTVPFDLGEVIIGRRGTLSSEWTTLGSCPVFFLFIVVLFLGGWNHSMIATNLTQHKRIGKTQRQTRANNSRAAISMSKSGKQSCAPFSDSLAPLSYDGTLVTKLEKNLTTSTLVSSRKITELFEHVGYGKGKAKDSSSFPDSLLSFPFSSFLVAFQEFEPRKRME